MNARSIIFATAALIAPLPPYASAHETRDIVNPHAHHMMMSMPETVRSSAEYQVPRVNLVRDDGQTVALADEIDDGRPVVLTFIYTTCTTICPMTSATLAQFEAELGADRDKVHIVSISIDPEHDTPARLAAYARKYGAHPEWRHYTGSVADSIAVQRAFDAYRGNKMNHTPSMFLRAAPGKSWVRIDGFATADELLAEMQPMLPSR